MILADQLRLVAARQVSQQAVPMRADIQKGMQLAAKIPHKQRHSQQLQREKVAIAGQILDSRDHMPSRPKQVFEFPLVLFGTNIQARRQDMG
jgi:hypothetical protein